MKYSKSIVGYRKVSEKHLASFARAMKNNMKAGIPIVTAFSLYEKQCKKGEMKKEIANIAFTISGGCSLREAFEKEGYGFTTLFKTMIFIGEESGQLQEIFKFLENYYLREYKRKKKIINISIYPIIVLLLGFIMGIIIIAKVLPQFFSMLNINKVTLPGITIFYMNISNLVNKLGIFILPIVFCIFILIAYLFKRLKDTFRFQKFLYKIPLLRSFLLKKFSCRFTLSLSIMLSSGVDFKSSLKILSDCEKEYVRNNISRVIEELVKGEGIYEAMKKVNIFPEYLLTNIYMGEVNGSLEEMLITSNEVLEEELNLDLERFINFLEPCLMLIVGGFVLSIVLSIMIPLFSIYDLKL